MSFTTKLALTEAEREGAYRLRYQIYVVDQNQHAEDADHARRLCYDPDDATARIFNAEADGEVIGTLRLHWGGDSEFSPGLVEPYDLDRFADLVPRERMMVLTRFMVKSDRRGGATAFSLIGEATRFGRDHGIELVFCDCQPHLIRLYTSLGFRTYRSTYNHPTSGLLVPLVLIGADIDYLRAQKSPLLAFVDGVESKPELAAAIHARISARPPLLRREDSSTEQYLAELGRAVERASLSLFDGLDADAQDRLLAQSHILACEAGDVLIRAGQTTRTLYVVLDGALEVRERGELVAVVGEGQVVGEVAFLMGGRRMSDVRVAAQGARVLALSEGNLRRLIETEAALAARLSLNLARIVCAKLQERSAREAAEAAEPSDPAV